VESSGYFFTARPPLLYRPGAFTQATNRSDSNTRVKAAHGASLITKASILATRTITSNASLSLHRQAANPPVNTLFDHLRRDRRTGEIGPQRVDLSPLNFAIMYQEAVL